jgi:hypothetical protein
MKIIIFISALFLSGCISYDKLGEGHDIWVAEQLGRTDQTLFYCSSNKQSSGEALPICYEAKLIGRKQKAKKD